MAKLNEIIDSLNDENVSDEDKVQLREDLKTEATALGDSNKQLYSRAKRAEGFEQKDGKWVKKPEPKKEPKKPDKPKEDKSKEEKKSDEPDYAKLAFLNGKKVSHPDDQKLVMDEAKRLDLPLTDILGMDHIKSKLKDSQDQREAEVGMPDSRGKPSGGNKGSVEHWIDKKNKDGTFASSGNLELDGKIIAARIKKEEKGNMFDSNDLYSG